MAVRSFMMEKYHQTSIRCFNTESFLLVFRNVGSVPPHTLKFRSSLTGYPTMLNETEANIIANNLD